MKYAVLLWPHSNNRYLDAIKPLALSELRMALGESNLSAAPAFERAQGASLLTFESALPPDALSERLGDLAHLFLMSEHRPDGALLPLFSRREAYLGADLPGILKYKGKTNEMFTHYLINMALHSSAFSDAGRERLRLIDPMCGRGTALFDAVNRGWDAFGADVDSNDIHETDAFFKRYLQYHRFKYRQRQLGMTLPGKRSLSRRQYRFANSPEAFKADDVSELSLMQADAAEALSAFPPRSFHLAAIDLPYGVQHAPSGQGKLEPLPALLSRVLPALRERLLPGGAVALSFNTHNLPLNEVRQALETAGLLVMRGGAYDGLEHWVEQAVARDVAVGVRKKG